MSRSTTRSTSFLVLSCQNHSPEDGECQSLHRSHWQTTWFSQNGPAYADSARLAGDRNPHATIKADWVRPGLFASLVDFDSYWSGDALRRSSKFTTDDVPQLEHYRDIGYFRDIPPICADLGELVAGTKPGREREDEFTVACNLGIALDDMATAPLVLRRARDRGLGRVLPL
jgi:hypothetical protein